MSVDRMQITPLEIPDVKLVVPERLRDGRGFLSEVYNKAALASAGIDIEFVQDNHSVSTESGTVRGLHFQSPPFAQDKLVRVVRGAAFDVAVDLRRGSPTYGRYASAVLSAEAWNQIFLPKGFAHGFCTLEPETEVVYKISAYYAREYDNGVLWNDSDVGIRWPVAESEAILSDKDRRLPRLQELPEIFVYGSI
jgi:dTDP-4-dehydrorhamnose 3,5-epimerase